jgi:putative polyhydroxyalkanoate system protein
MANISISRSFTSSQAEVKEQLEGLTSELSSRYDLKCQWESENHLTFKRSGASGEIVIGEGTVSFDMKLGMLLSALKGKVESKVNRFMDEHIS